MKNILSAILWMYKIEHLIQICLGNPQIKIKVKITIMFTICDP
jgi:hypothetical protein